MALRLTISPLSQAARRFSTTTVAASSLDRIQTKENYEHVLDKFAEFRACAVLRTATSEACPKAMQAAIDGGFKICEFTLTTPDCLSHLADFRQKYDGQIMIGCGTIMNTDDAAAAIDAGAEFIITPVMLPDVIEWCAKRNIVCAPGCGSPTEMVTAYRHG
jgi:2-dehydro-3-deoxyphosphogluconate aldolase/(4S)-4-hydroxy-2-oxoglutarate aldolase